MPEDAWSLKAVIKTSRGTHWMSFDQWGDSTHKMSTYNNRKHPSHKDQMYIDWMEAENMVMFPYQEPYAVTRSYPVGGTEQPKRINQRAENLKTGSPALQNTHSTGKQENGDHPGSPYRRPKLTGPQGRYRKRKNQSTPAWKSQGIAHKGSPPPPTRQNSLDEDELPDDTAFLDHKTNDETDYKTPPKGPQDEDNLDKDLQTKSLMDLDHDLTNYFEGHKQCNYFESNEKPLQGGGDIEPISPPAKATSPKAESNILTETWYLEPNKVRFMDDIDTHRANVGRHIPKQGKLVRAKIVPHLVFVNPPASPDGEQPPLDTTKGEASLQPTVEKEAVTPEPVGHSEDQSPKERPSSLPIPLEPQVMDLSSPKKDIDPDCLVVEDPSEVPYKPKKNWVKRKMEQTKKTLVLHLPWCDASKIKREMDDTKQEDIISFKPDEKTPGAIPPPTPDSENNPLEELD